MSDMDQSKSHLQALGNGLQLQRREGKYVDFTLVSMDGTRHECHKVVLAAVSPYFDTMFGSGMQEMEENVAHVDFDSGTVELLLQYLYTGDNVITVDSVPELYSAANFLQISTLQTECEEFLMSNKDPGISLRVWQIAKLLGRYDIADIAKGNVLQNFDMFCKVDSIGEVSFDNLKELLQDKLTNCSGVVKSKAGWIWLIAQESPDLEHTKKLLEALVSSENVESSDICEACGNDWDQQLGEVEIEELDHCADLWRKACAALWIRSEPTVSGVDMSLSECLIIVGGDPLDESKLTLFDYKKGQWFKVESDSRDLGHRFAVCSRGSFLYLSGGVSNPKRFLCFNADSKSWTEQENLPIGRQQHNMVTVPANTVKTLKRNENKQIYILGGSTNNEPFLTEVHVYDTSNMCWKYCGNTASPVTGACSAVVDKKIYLFGGVLTRSGSKSPSDLIQCYDTESNISWNVELKLPMKAKSLKMSVVRPNHDIANDDVFVVHGGKIYKITLRRRNSSVEEMVTISDAPLKGFGAAGFGNRIYIFGGEDDDFRCTRNIFQFDTQSGQAITLPSPTPFLMKDFVCCDIPVPSSWDTTEY